MFFFYFFNLPTWLTFLTWPDLPSWPTYLPTLWTIWTLKPLYISLFIFVFLICLNTFYFPVWCWQPTSRGEHHDDITWRNISLSFSCQFSSELVIIFRWVFQANLRQYLLLFCFILEYISVSLHLYFWSTDNFKYFFGKFFFWGIYSTDRPLQPSSLP